MFSEENNYKQEDHKKETSWGGPDYSTHRQEVRYEREEVPVHRQQTYPKREEHRDESKSVSMDEITVFVREMLPKLRSIVSSRMREESTKARTFKRKCYMLWLSLNGS